VTTAISAINHATRRTWVSSGLSSRSTRSESAASAPARFACRCEDERPRLALGAGRAGEHQLARLQRRYVRVLQGRGAQDRQRLAGERRQIDFEIAVKQPGVGRDAVALLHH
jgi:hypothetical protein